MRRRRKLTLTEQGIIYWLEGVLLFGSPKEKKRVTLIAKQFEQDIAEKSLEELMARVRDSI